MSSVERAPGDPALRFVEALAERVDAVLADVFIRVLRVAELAWVEDP
jgi:hypothetical protein